MKKLILLLVIATGMAACASGGSRVSDQDASSAASGEGTVERKKVCKYERSSGTGSTMERNCKWVDVTS